MDKTQYYVKAYTMDWNTIESNSLHLSYSYDKTNWYALNGNNGVLFSSIGNKKMFNPLLHRKCDGNFMLVALDEENSPNYLVYDSINLIEYTNEHLEKIDAINIKYENIISVTEVELNLLKQKWGSPEPVGDQNLKNINYITPLIKHRADPFIYKHTDGYYYFTASYTDMAHNLNEKYQYDRILIRKSKTINGLSDSIGDYIEKTIYKKSTINNMTQSPHVWAPEIHFIDDKWYIYYTTTISDTNKWAIRPHVLECSDKDPLTGNWLDKGLIQKTNPEDMALNSFSLDHTSFEHNGTRYLLWAQSDGDSNIYIAKMSNPWTICTDAVLLTKPEYNWETHGYRVNEGPSILKRNGKIFMVFSASGTDALYCLGMLTADEASDLLDPTSWVKTPYPVFQSSSNTKQYGPGHNSFTVSEDGLEDVLVYHSRNEERYLVEKEYQPLYDAGRNTCVMKILWNEDGTPNFSVPAANTIINENIRV